LWKYRLFNTFTMQAKKHILMVDDDAFVQQAMKFMLTALKVDFTIATNGEEATKIYKERKGDISTILMDLQMPKLDGFEASKQIRDFEFSNKLPATRIIALSGDDDDSTKKRAISSGMQGFLKKPVKKDLLATFVQ